MSSKGRENTPLPPLAGANGEVAFVERYYRDYYDDTIFGNRPDNGGYEPYVRVSAKSRSEESGQTEFMIVATASSVPQDTRRGYTKLEVLIDDLPFPPLEAADQVRHDKILHSLAQQALTIQETHQSN